MVILNIVVLMFEILYYSLFMKFSKREGSIWKYLLLFTIITILIGFININYLITYFVLSVTSFYGLKTIYKIKVIDFPYINLMFIIKFVMEAICITTIGIFNEFYAIILFSILKLCFVFAFRNRLFQLYKYMSEKWYKNDFIVRYISSILLIIYTLLALIYLLFFR